MLDVPYLCIGSINSRFDSVFSSHLVSLEFTFVLSLSIVAFSSLSLELSISLFFFFRFALILISLLFSIFVLFLFLAIEYQPFRGLVLFYIRDIINISFFLLLCPMPELITEEEKKRDEPFFRFSTNIF